MISVELIEYLEQNTQPIISENRKHELILKKLLREPSIIGIEGVLESYRDVKFGDELKGSVIDLVFVCERDFYLVEVKTFTRKTKPKTKYNIKRDGKYQLWDAHSFCVNNLGVSPHDVLVTSEGRKIEYMRLSEPPEYLVKGLD